MKITVRQPAYKGTDDKEIILTEISIDDIKIEEKAIMSIDGSTSATGVAIIRQSDGGLMYTMLIERDKKEETPVRYKIGLKKNILRVLKRNPKIDKIYYEEPILGHPTAIANLMMLRAFVEEMLIENEPHLDYISHFEINNKRWKKLFMEPTKLPGNTEAEKKMVRNKLEGMLPFMSAVSQDEIDATIMGHVAARELYKGTADETLLSKKKARPFMYECEFIGADEEDEMLMQFYDAYKGPKSVLENGVSITEMGTRGDFDKHVYQTMSDDDKVLVIKFPSNKHGNIILKHKLGYLSAQFSYIYAIVWRKYRKYD